MTAYVKATDFASKDIKDTSDPGKVIKGTEIDDEYNSIQTAVNSKADVNSPVLTGTPLAPTASVETSTTQIATTAFVQNVVTANQVSVISGDGPEAGLVNNSNVLEVREGYNGYGIRTVSTSSPSGGSDGDIWYKVS